ncbi:MAG TPA: nicotinate-nucleotide adenylyltransferase [Candidatus Eremiobacteraceae bacterium]|nr:nicotinate-nucleotide adenylyltransferase [Candidatus Eremiobacteraceae bacterium]
MSAARVGVLGGTFDPIHIGHLRIAEAVRDLRDLDRVLFVPIASPAHRSVHAAAGHREAMTRLAIAANPRFAVDRAGLEQPGPAYTADTLALLHAARPDDALFFIAGLDSLARSTWRRLDEVAAAVQEFVVVSRAGVPDRELEPVLRGLPEDVRPRFTRATVPMLEVSSTAIREAVKERRSIRYLVPDAVVDYIEANGLYR